LISSQEHDPLNSLVLTQVLAALHNLPHRNGYDESLRYEAAWTHSWTHHRCFHPHRTLIEAAECALPQGPGWYVIAVENGKPRQLTYTEETTVNNFRFAPPRIPAQS
jgi:hypothetical protein